MAQIIVCYNYHSAELRVSGLPKMALWYICTFGLWYIWTLAHLYLLFSPIVVQMGDAAMEAFPALPAPHYRTDGGRCHGSLSSPSCTPLSYRWGMIITQMGDALLPKWGTPIIVQMGDAAIEAFPVLPAPHYRTNGGRCHRSLSSPSCTPLSYRWGTLP